MSSNLSFGSAETAGVIPALPPVETLSSPEPQPAKRQGSPFLRLLSSTLFAVLLAGGLLIAGPIKGSVVHPVEAAAASYCWYWGQYQLENVSYSSTRFWDVYLGRWNYLNVEIDTYCYLGSSGYQRQYHSMQWTSLSTSAYSYTAVRVWVCGGYAGSWARYGWDVWSPWFSYGGCGRQADNIGSWTYLNYNGQYVSKYVAG
jgi:hypothetical protein